MSNLVLLVFAFVFCIIAAFFYPQPAGTPWYGRVHFGWLGISCWIATMLFKG
jgi:hypothetical protein